MRPIDADYVKSKLNKSALGGHLHYYVCGVIDDAPTIMMDKAAEVDTLYTNKHNEEDYDERCPICEYSIEHCQCMYGGKAHPNRDLRMEVVFQHLYLLSEEQLKHIVKLQERMNISSEGEYTRILNDLIHKHHKEESL